MSNKISLEIIFWNHAIIFMDGLVSNQLYNDIFSPFNSQKILRDFQVT